ncbi:RHS repeat domain-containing protein, partial [Paenibacillus campi]|uniref:RHS repeat domain-containing protein n=1 Tax=Paenibacillus campi TaxID=3106031 RepID=UPI002AFF160B
MFTDLKSTSRLRPLVIGTLTLLLLFSSIVSPAEADATSGKQVQAGKPPLTSIEPPSRTATPQQVEPEAWTTVVNQVYQDVYEAPNPQMEALADQIVQLDAAEPPTRNSSAGMFAPFALQEDAAAAEREPEPESDLPPTDGEDDPISLLGEQGIYALLQDGAEPLDIYWIEYLMRLTGQTGEQIWNIHKEQHLTWKAQESAARGAVPTVTDQVYGTGATSKAAPLSEDTTTDTDTTLSVSSPRLQANSNARAATLSVALDSALENTEKARQIQNLGEQNYADKSQNDETISPSGGLSWSQNQIHLPGRDGLDLDIGVRYDSTDTSPYTISPTRRSGTNWGLYNASSIYNDLGMGWSFQFPSMEGVWGNPQADGLTYHSGGGQSYYVYFNWANRSVVVISLKKDSGQDIQVTRDQSLSSRFSNGEDRTLYMVSKPDGSREYFSDYGNIVGQVDRFGNTITYHYQDRAVNPGRNGKGRVLSSITDTLGRKVTFEYETKLQQGSDFQGENIIVTVWTPQGQATQRVVYTKSRVQLLNKGRLDDGTDSTFVPLLQRITNNAQETQTFAYDLTPMAFTFNYNYDEHTPNFLLNRVQSPRLTQHYTYQPIRRSFVEKGECQENLIQSRYDTYNLANGADSSPVNTVDYTYVGDPTIGYNAHDAAGNWIHPTVFRYSQTAHIRHAAGTEQKTITSVYNGFHQHLSTETRTAQGEVSTENNQAFDGTYFYKPTHVQTTLQDRQGTITRDKDIVYADWGGIQSETDDLIPADYNNTDSKTHHTVTYTYESTYHQVTSKTWYPTNSGAALNETYAYTGSGRLQQYTNAAGETTTYSYDAASVSPGAIQRMTVQKAIRSGVTLRVTTTYSADDSYAYPTEQTSTFTNADSTTRTTRQTMTYDIGTGLLTSQTDSDGNTTRTSYDALGRPVNVVQPSMTNLDGTVYAIEDQYAYTNRVYSAGADPTNTGILTLRVDSIRQYTNKSTGAVTVLNRQATYYDGLGFLRVLETYPDTNGWTRSQAHPDDLGRIVYVVDALGNTQTASYDAWDQQTEFTDAEGNLSITKPLLTQQQTQHYTIAAADVGAYRSNPDNTSIRLNLLEQYFDA